MGKQNLTPYLFALVSTALLGCSFSYSFSTDGAPVQLSNSPLVVVDMYSGRGDNPTWPLSQANVQALARTLTTLSSIACPEPPGNLGYRGFLVHLPPGAIPGATAVQAFRGTIWLGDWPLGASVKGCLSDASRQIERILLDSGRPHLDSDIYDFLKKEISPSSTTASAPSSVHDTTFGQSANCSGPAPCELCIAARARTSPVKPSV